MGVWVAVAGDAVVVDIAFDACTGSIADGRFEQLIAAIAAAVTQALLAAVGAAFGVPRADAQGGVGTLTRATDAGAAFFELAC